MAAQKTETTTLAIAPRDAAHSRATRRLRRAGRVPGVLYGLDQGPAPFSADARELRHALHGAGAVIELDDGSSKTAAVLKEAQRHPVRGDVIHVDMLRVDLDKPIQAPVALHLVGAEDAPGVREGGVLEHPVREITVEALPNDIPEALELDVSGMAINDTATVAQISVPTGVTIVDDPEVVVATLTPPRLTAETEELETETEVVGEGEAPAEAEAEAEGADEAAGDEAGSDGSE
ncbi:MAG TPA: 50S ribosomal protein L25 [Solirubrobacteraceae bacterium]|jgi:large subunit ribosomal protein L25|nr:50S ribosomal protein L25 [Solirubrobacteraceae bacterium]